PLHGVILTWKAYTASRGHGGAFGTTENQLFDSVAAGTMMAKWRDGLVDLSTVVLSVAAITMVATQFMREPRPSNAAFTAEPVRVDEWNELISLGHRSGPEGAATTVLEFGDYECNACLRFQQLLNELLVEFPNDLAFVYR